MIPDMEDRGDVCTNDGMFSNRGLTSDCWGCFPFEVGFWESVLVSFRGLVVPLNLTVSVVSSVM